MVAVGDSAETPDAERRFLLTDVPWALFSLGLAEDFAAVARDDVE